MPSPVTGAALLCYDRCDRRTAEQTVRDKKVAAGTIVPGVITRQEPVVCDNSYVWWSVRRRNPHTRLLGYRIASAVASIKFIND